MVRHGTYNNNNNKRTHTKRMCFNRHLNFKVKFQNLNFQEYF